MRTRPAITLGIIFSAVLVTAGGCVSQPASNETLAKTPSVPEIVGKADAALEEAASRAIVAVQSAVAGDFSQLISITGDQGLTIFPAFACNPNLLAPVDMKPSLLEKTVSIVDCQQEDEIGLPPVTWRALLETISAAKALESTDRIVFNKRDGVGFNTGSSYLAEIRYPAEPFRLAVYYYLGTPAGNYRDWEEVGFVFDGAKQPMTLVAVYRDVFSSI